MTLREMIEEDIYNKMSVLFRSYWKLKKRVNKSSVVLLTKRTRKLVVFLSKLSSLVIVIEPNPNHANYLGVMAKRLGLKNIRVLSYGLADKPCKKELYEYDNKACLLDITEFTEGDKVIDCMRLDDLIDILCFPKITHILGGIKREGAEKTLLNAEVIE